MAEDEVKPVAVFCFPAVKNPDIMPLWFCFCVRLFARPFHHFSCLIYTLQVQAFIFFLPCRTRKSSAHSFTFWYPKWQSWLLLYAFLEST